jgi:hypothetical protein
MGSRPPPLKLANDVVHGPRSLGRWRLSRFAAQAPKKGPNLHSF